MNPRILFFTFLIFTSANTIAQHHKDNWYFGFHAAINFSSGSPVNISGSAMNVREGNATVSDNAGNLLFYTNGLTVWDASNSVMPNGFGLASDNLSCQAALIVPQPGSTTLYYLFTTDTWEFTPNDLRYSIIDMSLNGGLGDVTSVKNVLVNNNVREQVTAVPHGNGTDFWIVSHEALNHNFVAYHLSAAGLDTIPVVSNLGMDYTGYNRYGCLHFSHNCTKLVSVLGNNNFTTETVQVYDFNSSLGVVSHVVTIATINSIPNPYSAEFSSDGSKLYVSDIYVSAVYQFDMTAPNIASTQTDITNSAPGLKSGLALGPDGKIYVGQQNTNFLSAINYPNASGLSCNFQSNAVILGAGQSCGIALPNNIEYKCERGASLSISELTDPGFQINPNPAKDNFTITNNSELKKSRVEIYNCIAQKVYEEELNTGQKTISCRMFSQGIYFVKVYEHENSYCRKLVVE